jgi:Putative nuclear envelope organisation protein
LRECYQICNADFISSWTESSLKSFLDHHGIPAPQPRTRDSLLTTARQNYDAIAKKANQYSAYPGDWLYSTWTDSDLKEYLDEHGYPVPQPTTRDKLIASVRRNAHLASAKMDKNAKAASSSATAAQESLSDALFDAWSDSKLKEFLDKNNVPVPQGSRRNELLALARKNRAYLTGEGISASASSAFGAATSKAGNAFAQSTDTASETADEGFEKVMNTWSDSRLKAFLDSRGVPVPQSGKRDELLSKVRLNKHKATSGWSAWTFDTWSVENLRSYLSANTKKAKKNAGASREDLMKQAQEAYASASKSGGSSYASLTSYLASATDAAKDTTFDSWSESDLKSYLDSYGVPNYQGSKLNELKAEAKKQANYFRYGTSTPQGTIFERLKSGANWMLQQLKIGAAQGRVKGEEAAAAASSAAQTASAKASASAKTATEKAKGEL